MKQVIRGPLHKLPFTAWIAFAESGYPALHLGIESTRQGLKRRYSEQFQAGDIEAAGYRLLKVRVTEVKS